MRFESFMWTLLALFLAGGVLVGDLASSEPTETNERFEAMDGTNTIPPGP